MAATVFSRPRHTRSRAVAVAAACAAGVLVLAASGTSASAAATHRGAVGSTSHRVVSHRVTPAVGVHPHHVRVGAPHPGGQVLFGCQTPAPGGLQCYGPDQIRAAYRIQPLLDRGITGRGRSIVIVDAFSPPTVASELAEFDLTWGLPDPVLSIVAPQGATPFDPNDANQLGWSAEIALDVEWSHVVAPDAKIVLVEARSNDDADILAATDFAVRNNLGDVISQSFGEDERCVDPAIARAEHRVFEQATARGITLIASSGDQGSAQPTCDGSSFSLAVSSPATDPLVLAVGGTDLVADGTTGAFVSETVWNESDTFEAAGGGGFSVLTPRPAYQRAVNRNAGRGVPDIAYNAAIDGGVLVDWQDGGGFFIFGGTSAGSPQWAGLTALADQLGRHRVGFVNPSLYAAGAQPAAARLLFHDTTVGDNTFRFADPTGAIQTIPGFPATRGWDAATGFGSPVATAVVPFLALLG